MIPNFFIVGAPKAGTTSIYNYLSKHPQIFFSNTKELNHFSSQELRKQKLYYPAKIYASREEYLSLFSSSKGYKVIGEASVSYLYYPLVPQKIYEFNPNAKILICLRDPVSRAFSHFLMDYRLGLVKDSFDLIVKRWDRNSLHFQQYILLGDYHDQIQRYLQTFGKQNVFILFQNDLKINKHETVKSVLKFLQVDHNKSLDLNTFHNAFVEPKNRFIKAAYKSATLRKVANAIIPKNFLRNVKDNLLIKTQPPKLSPALRKELIEYYREDITKLARLIDVDLSNWLK